MAVPTSVPHLRTYQRAYGIRLATARRRREWTQEQFGQRANATRSSVAAWETGRVGVRAYDVIRHATILGVSPMWLLTGHPIPAPNKATDS